MIAPEQWQEYQKKYQRYGFEMAPETDSRRERIERRKAAQKSEATVLTLRNDRRIILATVLFSAIMVIMVVVMAAFAAKITYDINKIKTENDVLIGEIEDMDVDILSTESIGYVEKTARKELHMKVAPEESTIYVSAEDIPQKGFGEIVKTKAYE
ncbi:MAG: hypothetical protein PUB09_01820 [Firmicutes bacterium]|nr:hypothetical protein [Bacillota bacterium]